MKQKINCDVKSCKFNDQKECICSLEQIYVKPCQGNCSGTDGESKCGSYKCCE